MFENSNNSTKQLKDNIRSDDGITYFRSIFLQAEKIVTAIFMVSDHLPTSDHIRESIRSNALHALEELLSAKNSMELRNVLNTSMQDIFSVVSAELRIAGTLGIISNKNVNLLLEVIDAFHKKIRLYYERKNERGGGEDTPYFFGEYVLTKQLFNEPFVGNDYVEKVADERGYFKGHENKGHIISKNGINNDKINLVSNNTEIENRKPLQITKKDIGLKINRRNNILSIIKDKREVTIKNITEIIKDCSEKTIQRELNTLVGEGVLKRVGEKRWSRYSLK